jgi:FO synthase
MHAVARLVLHPFISNIQASWVKLGADGAAACLQAGANDLGGTLMNESITRAAGGVHGQLLDAAQLAAIAHGIGRPARQRTTLYGTPPSVTPPSGIAPLGIAPLGIAPSGDGHGEQPMSIAV